MSLQSLIISAGITLSLALPSLLLSPDSQSPSPTVIETLEFTAEELFPELKTQTVTEGEADTLISAVLAAPVPFNVLIPAWRGSGDPELSVRTSPDGEIWPEWQRLQLNEDWVEPGGQWTIGNMVLVAGSRETDRYIQVRLELTATTQLADDDLENIRLTLIDSTNGPTADELAVIQNDLDSTKEQQTCLLYTSHLITHGELGKMDEVIHIFVLHEEGHIRSIFREPSLQFHRLAGEVSPILLPPERLAGWRNLRLAENNSIQSNNEFLYKLPWAGGVRYRVYQDYDKHYDFQLPVGDVVRSARGGLIKTGVGSYGEYYVRIDHQDGTWGFYVHLQANTFLVSDGTFVEQGRCIARSGATGSNITGAHLHFNVSNSTTNNFGNYLVAHFVEGAIPTGGNYTPLSQNSAASCDQSSDPLTVNPPPISPSAGTCSNGWNQIAGFAGQPAYTTRNAQSSSQSTNSATWIPTIAQAGTYGVEAYIPNHGTAFCNTSVSYDTTNAVYTLTDSNNASFTKSVNQQPLADVWVYLGDLYCNAGQSCRVRLTDITGEQLMSRTVSFSAVRFVLKTAPPTYSISGSITEGNGAGLGGVSVSAGGKTAQTDSSGNYVISDLPAGAHTVSPLSLIHIYCPRRRPPPVGRPPRETSPPTGLSPRLRRHIVRPPTGSSPADDRQSPGRAGQRLPSLPAPRSAARQW